MMILFFIVGVIFTVLMLILLLCAVISFKTYEREAEGD